MGPSGCGKTTTSKLLSAKIGWPFIEGDDYHSESNRYKMKSGIPLDDDDRLPWLNKLNELISIQNDAVVDCSALKQSYRKIITYKDNTTLFVLLNTDENTLMNRLENRKGHFFNLNLLRSQLNLLEPFLTNELHFTIDNTNLSCEDTVNKIIKYMGQNKLC